MRHINKFLTFCLLALASVGFSGCSDDDFGIKPEFDEYDPDTQLVLDLALPEQNASTRASMSVDGTEGKINNLRLLVFHEDGTLAKNQELPVSDLASITGSNGISRFQVKGFVPGKYWIYIVANMGNRLDNVQNETQLKGIFNEYSAKNLPAPGNLPMIYEPGGQLTELAVEEKDPKVIETSLKIAAVKVKYNIIFDKTGEKGKECANIFGNSGLKINNIKVNNVAEKAYLVENTSDTDTGSFSFDPAYSFYNGYVEDRNNESADDKDVITLSDKVSSGNPNRDKWVCAGILYLPERYVAAGGTPTSMAIDAVVLNESGNETSVKCNYTINLAQHNGDKNAVSMPRDTYYEVVARVKSLGSANIDASTTIKEWSSITTRATFSGTYLKLVKTTGKVTSLTDDAIEYETDAKGDPLFDCETKIGNEPAVIGVKLEDEKKIKLMVNPKVSIDNLPNDHGEGVAICWIQIGNIKKQIRVDYDITPFFIIEPLETKVQWSDTDQAIRTKEYSYRTNLGGLMITSNNDNGKGTIRLNGSTGSYVSTEGNSQLELSCSNPSAAMGVLKVTAKTNPQTTTVHEFDAYPAKAASLSKYESMKKDLRITVMPPLGGYRIYFRAINDWHKFDGGDGNISSEWLEGGNDYPTEFYGSTSSNQGCMNWYDYWYVNGYNGKGNYTNGAYYPHNSSHRIYIWTQTGERVGVDDNPPVWRFTDVYTNAPSMNGDYTNPGWYYYDLSATAYQVGKSETAGNDNKIPEPGTTLMIFHNTTNAGTHGFTVHRVPGHLEPGVPLFDYEDREGWVLYDPTTESLYRVFDEKPYIRDVTYTIYSDVEPTGWWRKYGIATKQPSGSGFPQYTIYSNHLSVTTETINGKRYYVCKIKMKAPDGYHAKAININFGGTTGGGTSTGQRVWYYSKNGWENPRVYVYSGDQKNAEWNSTPSMTKDRTEGGGTYYYYDIPSNLSNGQVIFQNSDRSQQNPAQNQAGRSLGGKTMVYYADSGSWMEYPGSTSSSSSTSTSYSAKLFGGRAFAGDTGTYNSATKTWTVGKPQ